MHTDTQAQTSVIRAVIVDDNEMFRSELVEYFGSQSGFEVIGQSNDGADAIMMAQTLHPDLVLMDISMPRISGVAAALKIKQYSPETKVVFVTIHEDPTYQAIAESLHMDGYVCKRTLKDSLPIALQRVKEEIMGRSPVLH